MIKNLEYKDKTIEKYWSATVNNTDVILEFGEIDSTGYIEKRKFNSNLLALEFVDKKIKQKTLKGYLEV